MLSVEEEKQVTLMIMALSVASVLKGKTRGGLRQGASTAAPGKVLILFNVLKVTTIHKK